ncbi:MAG: hypothetical protein LBE56_02665 [Tannerella sp.]|jgi:hypothetical protein|nr:hypothetical protein [Tannerella sp.]
MNQKKISHFMTTLLLGAICAVFLSCNDKEVEPQELDYSWLVKRATWYNYLTINDPNTGRSQYNVISTVYFGDDGKYTFQHSTFGVAEGDYTMSEPTENVPITHIYINPVDQTPHPNQYITTMYRVFVSGSSSFEELRVYYWEGDFSNFLFVEVYFNNVMVGETMLYQKDDLPF